MAKTYHRIYGEAKWASMSGTAIIALVNQLSSGKRIEIKSIEVQPNTRFGASQANNTQSALASRFKLCRAASVSGGDLVPIAATDTLKTFPVTAIQIKTNTAYVPEYAVLFSGSDNTVAAGDTTWTPASAPSPVWITSEHLWANRKLRIITSQANSGTYNITANGTNNVTISHPFISATAASGDIIEEKCIRSYSVNKTYNPSTFGPHTINFGNLQGQHNCPGGLLSSRNNTNVDDITLIAGEKAVLCCPMPMANFPLFISGTIIESGNTYTFGFFTNIICENQAVISFDNNIGSGRELKIRDIRLSEVGNYDTPYIQLVPVGAIDFASLTDVDKRMTIINSDSGSASYSPPVSAVTAYCNVPFLPLGVPTSYLSDSSAGSPKGFNYLNTKDFIGPAYAAIFPEVAAYKTWPRPSSVVASGLANLGHSWSKIKGFGSDIILNEGEGIALAPGAETATITTAVAMSGWISFEYGITFAIDNAYTPKLTLTGLKPNTEVRVYQAGTQTELAGQDEVVTGTFQWYYDYIAYTSVDIVIHALGYQWMFIPAVAIGVSDVTIPIQQILDRQYLNP